MTQSLSRISSFVYLRFMHEDLLYLRNPRRLGHGAARSTIWTDSLNTSEPRLADVEDGIDILEECVAEDVKGQVSARLDAAEGHAVTDWCECDVLELEMEEVSVVNEVAAVEYEQWQCCGVIGEVCYKRRLHGVSVLLTSLLILYNWPPTSNITVGMDDNGVLVGSV